ncbi:MAG: PD-(D/E)XK nuclease domain-containing protein, partial [Candidatus Symbiothrix sp.]|jgi:capsular polysaccharide biosynthesis protein|nr:PD-(D/E)XK nuclease domain-containing protein [Candidatus Symbiothrix sp.]
LVVSHKRNTYIIELKVAKKDKSPAAKAAEAYNQIFEQNYHKPYPAAICIGLAIDDEKREITEYKTNVEPE